MIDPSMDPPAERALAAFNEQDLEGVLAEFAEGGTFTDPFLDGEVSGVELREYFADLFVAAPDLHLEVKRVIAADDGLTAIEGEYVGTHKGPIGGIPATGNAVAIPTVVVIDTSDDGITVWRDYWDRRTFFEQLGLTFPDILPLLPKLVVAKARAFI